MKGSAMARDADEKYRILAEIFTLLSEQERSVPEIAEYGEVPEHSLRAKRIEDLLAKVA
jgi:hypothetical protein